MMRRILRYCGLALVILFVFWVVSLAVIYFLVDANDLKKFAVQTVNENTSGELNLGEVKLKFFPLVHFQIKDLNFKSSPNFDKKEMFSCKSTNLSFNLFTLIIGKPRITLHLVNPSLNFISDGKTNNIGDAFKTEKKSKSPDVLTYLFISKFIFNIDDADLSYKTPKDTYKVKGLNLDLEVDPVSRGIDLKIETSVDYKKLDTVVAGDFSLSAYVKSVSKDKAEIKATIDATKLAITTKAIQKKKGDALKILANGETDLKNTVSIENVDIFLIDKFLSATNGEIKNFSSGKPSVSIEVRVSKDFDFSNLSKIVLALKDYKISGKLDKASFGVLYNEGSLSLPFNIDATNLSIEGKSFKKDKGVYLSLRSERLNTDFKSVDMAIVSRLGEDKSNDETKAALSFQTRGSINDFSGEKPVFDVELGLALPSIKRCLKFFPDLAKQYPMLSGSASLKATVNGSTSPLPVVDAELKYSDDVNKNNLGLKISNTEKARTLVVANISSSYINLNPYLPPEEKSKKSKTAKGAKAAKGAASSAGEGDSASEGASKSVIDEDMPVVKKEQIEMIKKSLDKYSIRLTSKIDKIISRDLVINNFIVDGLFNKEELSINKINLGLLKGEINGAFKTILDVNNPTYKGKMDLKGVKVKDAAGIFMPGIKGVVDGTISAGLDFTAAGYSMKPIKNSMVAKGTFALNNFEYSAQELNSIINDKLKDKLGSLGFSGNKKILGSNAGWETVQGTFNIKDGKINVEQLFAKEGEYEATGKGEVTFNEYMDMFIDVTVPYRNIPYEAIKVEGKDKSMLPLHLSGPILKPKFDAAYLIKYIADRALKHETEKLKAAAAKEVEKLKQQAQERAVAEAKKAAEPIKQKANEEVKKAGEQLKKAFKGFKF